MTIDPTPGLRVPLRRAQLLSAWMLLAIGTVVLGVGWYGGVDAVTHILPELSSMKANTATLMLLIGVALHPAVAARHRGVVLTTTAVVVVVAVVTLVQYVADLDVGVDELLVVDRFSAGTASPGRMGLNSAICFVCVGLNLFLSALDDRPRAAFHLTLVGLSGLLSVLALLGYVFGVVSVRGIASATEMALHTAVAFTIALVGVAIRLSDRPPFDLIASPGSGGQSVRRLVPATAGALIVVGLVVQWARSLSALEDASTELAFQGALGMAVVIVIAFATGRRLDVVDQRAARAAVEVERARDELRMLNAELERRVEERTRELADANEELARSNRELEQFAYVASHDLQEPLRMVSGFVSRIGDRYGDQLDDRGQEYVRLAVDGAERMAALIDALLRYSRVGRAELQFDDVDLADVLEEAVWSLRTNIAESGATVDVGEMPVVTADPVLITQVLQNLLGNALKFQAPDRAPHVVVSSRPEGDGHLIDVQDNGIGIPEEFRGEVFRMFRRLTSRQAYPGTGIGLSIVERIVHRHGGTIEVAATGGPGTTMRLWLPGAGRREQDSARPVAAGE